MFGAGVPKGYPGRRRFSAMPSAGQGCLRNTTKWWRMEFGLLWTTLLWIHSFEEPFHSAEDMTALAPATHFGWGETRFVGVLCRSTLQKGGTRPTPT
jgi:hypothetical protein